MYRNFSITDKDRAEKEKVDEYMREVWAKQAERQRKFEEQRKKIREEELGFLAIKHEVIAWINELGRDKVLEIIPSGMMTPFGRLHYKLVFGYYQQYIKKSNRRKLANTASSAPILL